MSASEGRLAVTERNQPAKHVLLRGCLALSLQQRSNGKVFATTNYLLESHSFDAALSNFRWHLGFCGPRAAPFALTPSFSSTVYERTGFVLNIEDFLNQLAQSFKLQHPTHSTRTIVPKWPPQSLIQRSIEYFAKNRLYSIFPAVDLENTPIHLDSKALGNPDSTTSPANYACLVALTALITRIRGNDLAFADADPDAYVQAVLTLLPELIIDNANIRSLEALTLLVLYIAPLGQPRPAGILLAMAIRMLYNMGANRNRAPPDETLEQSQHRQHVRALFWVCYSIDKEMSLRECKAPLINDADCDLHLPAAYVSTSSNRSFFPEPLSTKELLLPSDLRLALIKSKIQHLLYSGHAKIHGASNNGGIPSRESWSLLPSSMEICHQSARSTLLYLSRMRHSIMPETFWLLDDCF
ncbi:hypothetical protein BDV37DRAFT_271202 [Aspergillus pseudonomiae]|uniref:Xylanolytic transcriptional activator regulatory domain-containing protein n=1 Tax=Aspergillus pseudonomiae TaxID=1506151 RepID=A0A5N7DFH0_9EURO|nr:uncharacterized protein BDV37DRAFT_271202 [Aspergillus pseudonomiae]KAE8404753.1 hypothetical protein BDV37DRAFT_271202 [Aspergillus pseudonomiae]